MNENKSIYKKPDDLYLDLINNKIITNPDNEHFKMINGDIYMWNSCYKFKPHFPFSKTGKWIGKWVDTGMNIGGFSRMCWQQTWVKYD